MPIRVVLTVLAIGLSPIQQPIDASTPQPPVSAPVVPLQLSSTLIGADAEQAAHVEEVLARYQRAGLALPDLEIRFDDDPAECRGHDGLFQEQYTPWRVLICSDLPYVFPHELAHAWEAANLTDEARRRYVARFGLTTWDGRDVPWNQRGEEHAAFVIQQNLRDTSADPDSPVWADKVAAYELLTGLPSPLRS